MFLNDANTELSIEGNPFIIRFKTCIKETRV